MSPVIKVVVVLVKQPHYVTNLRDSGYIVSVGSEKNNGVIDETSAAFTLCDHYLFGGRFGTARRAAAGSHASAISLARTGTHHVCLPRPVHVAGTGIRQSFHTAE